MWNQGRSGQIGAVPSFELRAFVKVKRLRVGTPHIDTGAKHIASLCTLIIIVRLTVGAPDSYWIARTIVSCGGRVEVLRQ